jgi:hypothetical protein
METLTKFKATITYIDFDGSWATSVGWFTDRESMRRVITASYGFDNIISIIFDN